MIAVIGKPKLIIIGVLVVAIGVLAAGVYQYLIPQTVKYKRELSSLDSQISSVRSDLSAIQLEFEQLEERESDYKALQALGFFNTQDRITARNILSNVQEESGVIYVKAAVGSIENIENKGAEKAGHQVLQSDLNIDIDSFDDLDFYEYIFLLNKYLPGYVTINRLALTREQNLSGDLLRQIASGGTPVMVSANVEGRWVTMAPLAENEEAE